LNDTAQKKALKNYRARLAQRGIARFEVKAPDADRELIRALARRLSEDGPEADDARSALKRVISGDEPRSGGILAALRRSPLVGTELDLRRPREGGRKVDL
jgi:hypothetical protein